MNFEINSINELFISYLDECYLEEDVERQNARSYINKMVKIERERIIKEITNSPGHIENKISKLKNFWNETFQVYGEDILQRMRPKSLTPFEALDNQQYTIFLRNIRIMIQFDNLVMKLLYDVSKKQGQNVADNIIKEIDSQNSFDSTPREDQKVELKIEKNQPMSNLNEIQESIGIPDFLLIKHDLLKQITQAKAIKSGIQQYSHHHQQQQYQQQQQQSSNRRSIVSFNKISSSSRVRSQPINAGVNSIDYENNNNMTTTTAMMMMMQSSSKTELKYISKKQKIDNIIKKPIKIDSMIDDIEFLKDAKTPLKGVNECNSLFKDGDGSNNNNNKVIHVDNEQEFYENKKSKDFNEDKPNILNVVMDKKSREKLHSRIRNRSDSILVLQVNTKLDVNENANEMNSNSNSISKNKNHKLHIQKNISNYSPLHQQPQKFINFSENIFQDVLKDIQHIDNHLIERVKKRYHEAYVDKYVIKVEYEKANQSKKTNNNNVKNLENFEFLMNKENQQVNNSNNNNNNPINDSKLLSGLLSPIKTRINPLMNGIISSSRIIIPEAETKSQKNSIKRAKRRTLSTNLQNQHEFPKKKPLNRNQIHLYREFDEEMLMQKLIDPNALENLQKQKSPKNHVKMHKKAKSINLPQKSSKLGDNVEDFILEMNYPLSTTNGLLTQKSQTKSKDFIKENPTCLRKNSFHASYNNLDQIITNTNDIPMSIHVTNRNNNNTSNIYHSSNEQPNLTKYTAKDIKAYLNLHMNGWTIKDIETMKNIKNSKLRFFAWASILCILANFDNNIALTNKRFQPTYEKLIGYLSQPGKIIMYLKNIADYISNNQINPNLLDDFRRYNIELDYLIDSDTNIIENAYDRKLIKLIYLISKYIIALQEQEELILEDICDNGIIFNKKQNKKYLDQAEQRKNNDDHISNEKKEENNLRINFHSWEKNLESLKEENKLLKQNEKEHEFTIQNEEKQQKIQKKKNELQFELMQNLENHIAENKERSKKHLNEKELKHMTLSSHLESKKAFKEMEQQALKVYNENEFEENPQNVNFSNKKREKLKKQEEKKQKIETWKNVLDFRNKQQAQKENSIQKQKIEKNWQNAQEIIEKQRLLLQERQQLDKVMKIYK